MHVSSGADERGGVLVEADADGKGIEGERIDEAAEAVALAKVLIDDESIGEPEARREAHAAGDHRRTLVAERNHVFAQDAGAGAGAADGDAMRVAHPDQLRHGRAAQQRGQPQLVAAREKNTGGRLEPLQTARFLAVPPRVEIHHGDVGCAQVLEDLFVARPGLVQAAGRGNDHDVGVLAAGEAQKAFQDGPVVFLVLGTPDGNDPAASLAGGNFTRHFVSGASCSAVSRGHIVRESL